MAAIDKKISELDPLAVVDPGDLFVGVDITASQTTKFTKLVLMSQPGPIGGTTPDTGAFSSLELVNVVTEFSTDGTLAGDSDDAVPTEKAVKTYVDAQIATTDEHDELLGLQGGDSTAVEFYHLTQLIHDSLFSESPTIGLGQSAGTNFKVDYGNNIITASPSGNERLNIQGTSQTIGLASTGVNVVLDQSADNISMYMDAGEGNGYSQVIDIDGDSGLSEINIGVQTQVYLKVGIGSGTAIRMMSGTDEWFDVDANSQRIGNNAVGGSYMLVTSGGDIDIYRGGTRYFDLASEIITIGPSTGVRVEIDYDDDQEVNLYGASGASQLEVSSSGVRLDYGIRINAFSNDPDPSDETNTNSDEKVMTAEAVNKHVQQTMSHNFMEPQTINRRAAESLKYGMGLNYLSYSIVSTSSVATTESKENVMVALQNGRGVLVYIDSLDDVKYRLVDEEGTSFVGAEQDLTTVGQGVYEDLGAVLLPDGNVFITMMDGQFAPANGTARNALIDQDGNILISPAGAPLTVVLDVALPAVTPGGNVLIVGKEGTGDVDNQLKYIVFDQEGNNLGNPVEMDGVIVTSASTASVGLLDNTFMVFFSDSTGNTYIALDRFGNITTNETLFGGTAIVSGPKAFLMNNGNVFLTYGDAGGDWYFQIISPTGEVRTSETQIGSGSESEVVAQQFSGGDIIIFYERGNQYYYQVRDLNGSAVVAETLQEADDFENANSMTQFNSGQIVVAYWDGTNRVLEAWAPGTVSISGLAGSSNFGNESLLNEDTTASVVFSVAEPDTNYSIAWTLVNTTDFPPSIYVGIVYDKTVNGFSVIFSGSMDTGNYELSWTVTR